MKMNPWFLERVAEYERDRIRRDMKQIRLEEAMRAAQKKQQPQLAYLALACSC